MHAPIFTFLTANEVLFDEQLQVACEGRPVHFHGLSQTMDRDRCNLGKGGKESKSPSPLVNRCMHTHILQCVFSFVKYVYSE